MNTNLNYIDSLRGIAILLVVFIHATQTFFQPSDLPQTYFSVFDYGQLGVQLFFIGSSVTLCYSAQRNMNEHNKTLKYFVRRLFRIAPLYYFGIFLYVIIPYISKTIYPAFVIPHGRCINKEATLNNVLLINGLVGHGNNNVVPGGWSIGTEVLFYVLFPIGFYLAQKLTTGRILLKISITLIAIISIQLLLIFMLRYWFNINYLNNSFTYYSIVFQSIVFIVGIFYFFISEKVKLIYNRLYYSLIFLIITAFIFKGILLNEVEYFAKYYLLTLLSGLSFIILLEILKNEERLNPLILQEIGKSSYSIYIIHSFFLNDLSGYYMPWLRNAFPINQFSFFIFYIIILFVVFKISYFTVKYIEQPFINLGKKLILKLN